MSYRELLNKAIDNSFDLKMSKLDIEISKAELLAAKSDLYPSLNLQANSEYNNGLGHTAHTIGYVGNTIISSYTQFRNLASIGLQYNLFDFGVINKRISIAKKEIAQKELMQELQLKTLKLKILEIYTKILETNEDLKVKSDILVVYEEMFKAKERLFKSGISDKISLMDEAIKVARTQDNIETSKLELNKLLNDLSIYTSQKYDANDITTKGFDNLNSKSNIIDINYKRQENAEVIYDSQYSLEAKYYDIELEKKKAELEIYKRQRYPSFKLYSSYLLYGQNPNQYFSAWNDLTQASFIVGVSGTYTFFDGFKNRASRQKAQLEIQKISVERDKKLAELQSEYETKEAAYKSYKEELQLKSELLSLTKEKLDGVNRLANSGIKDKNEVLTSQAELLNQEADLQKNIIYLQSKIIEIEITEGRDI